MKRIMAMLLKEPLFIFVLFSILLFCIFLSQKAVPDNVIIVSEGRLKEFYQYRRQSFGWAAISNKLQVMSTEERNELTEEFIRAEVLVREARRMGLDEGDFIIRQRLIQKLEFLSDTQANIPEKAEALLVDWFEKNKDNYRQPSEISFTHIYFIHEGREKAQEVLAALISQDPMAITEQGNRFLYHKSYQRKSQEEITAHFGENFASSVFDLPFSSEWQGPLASRHGYHLVRITDKSEAQIPELMDVRQKVLFDLKLSLSLASRNEYADTLRDKYTIISK